MTKQLPTYIIGLLAIFLATLVCFYNLNNQSIDIQSDEVIHARVVQDMWVSMDLLHPTMGKQAYLNKPPLKLWLSLIPIAIWGESNFSYRFIDAIAAVFTVCATFVLGIKLYRSSLAAFAAAFFLSFTPTLILGRHGARRATQDSLLVLFITLAMICLLLIVERKKLDKKYSLLLVLAGTLTGCAVLTKSIAGLLPLIIAIPFFASQFSAKSTLMLLVKLVAASMLLPAIYFGLNILFTPDFFKIAIMRELVERGTRGFHNQSDYWYYFRTLFGSWNRAAAVIPPAVLVPALLLTAYDLIFRKSLPALFTMLWAIIPLVLYSIPRSRLAWYLAPAFPAYALMAGYWCYKLFAYIKQFAQYWRTYSLLPRALLAVCLLTVFFAGTIATVRQVTFFGPRVFWPTNKRLALDLFAESFRKLSREQPLGPVILHVPFMNTKSDDHRGHFNVEAIYLRTLLPNLIEVKSEEELKSIISAQPRPSFVFTQAQLLQQEPQFEIVTQLPAFHYRRNFVDIVSYLPAEKSKEFRDTLNYR